VNRIHIQSGDPSVEFSVAGAERSDDQFFEALRAADLNTLDALLAHDFVLVDVFAGATIDRHGVIGSVGTGQLVFDSIETGERVARRYGDVVVIVGRTSMTGSFEGGPFEVASRYTHVLRRGDADVWHLVSAQGTRIEEPRPQTRVR
jgi:ketosteroid isomerase-like protein